MWQHFCYTYLYQNEIMKKLIYILLLVNFGVLAQGKVITKTGSLNFEASVPSFEEVVAKNNSVTAILNTDNGEFAALALVKGFRFKNALMEEHFNENYAESDEFPKATFKGTIKDLNISKITESARSISINGELNFHGKTKKLKDLIGTISKKGDKFIMSGVFELKVSDFDIKIPKVVRNKVSDTVDVTFQFELSAK